MPFCIYLNNGIIIIDKNISNMIWTLCHSSGRIFLAQECTELITMDEFTFTPVQILFLLCFLFSFWILSQQRESAMEV